MITTANKNPVVDTASLKMTGSLADLQPDRKIGNEPDSTTNLQPFSIYSHVVAIKSFGNTLLILQPYL